MKKTNRMHRKKLILELFVMYLLFFFLQSVLALWADPQIFFRLLLSDGIFALLSGGYIFLVFERNKRSVLLPLAFAAGAAGQGGALFFGSPSGVFLLDCVLNALIAAVLLFCCVRSAKGFHDSLDRPAVILACTLFSLRALLPLVLGIISYAVFLAGGNDSSSAESDVFLRAVLFPFLYAAGTVLSGIGISVFTRNNSFSTVRIGRRVPPEEALEALRKQWEAGEVTEEEYLARRAELSDEL